MGKGQPSARASFSYSQTQCCQCTVSCQHYRKETLSQKTWKRGLHIPTLESHRGLPLFKSTRRSCKLLVLQFKSRTLLELISAEWSQSLLGDRAGDAATGHGTQVPAPFLSTLPRRQSQYHTHTIYSSQLFLGTIHSGAAELQAQGTLHSSD